MNRKEEKRKVAKNLHRQFAHVMPVKLTELMKNADINNKELCVIIKEIAKEYEVCSKYQKKKCAAIDLKEWTFQEKVWLINIVDHLTSDTVQLVSFIQKGKRL